MTYRAYEFGVIRLLDGEDALCQQLVTRGQYWNRLVEIERDYQAEKEAALRATNDALNIAQATVDQGLATLEQAQAARFVLDL